MGARGKRLHTEPYYGSCVAELYNTERLHSALGYVTPHDYLAGRQAAIHAERDRKLEAARERRRLDRQATASAHKW